jgi:hypothetical protein
MQNLDIDEIHAKPVETSTYHIPKKLFWPVVLVFNAILIVLLVLVIYFGVRQNSQNSVENGSTKITTSPLPPVKRIPDNLQQLFYRLTITPNLNDKTFTGKENLYM